MDRVGLTFDEYVDVKLRPPAGADQAIQRGFEAEVAEKFPMATVAASTHLRSRGYDCRPAMLDVLVKNGVVNLAQPDTWTRDDVDAAAEYFEQSEMFIPYAAMCQTLGCRYIDRQVIQPAHLLQVGEPQSGWPIPETRPIVDFDD